MTSPGTDPVACLLCRVPTAPWMTVPGDWQRPDDPGPYALRWCPACRFGQVHPRPERDRIPGFYRIDSYYTHEARPADPGPGPLTLVDRLRIKLAWLNDPGGEMDDAWLRGRVPPGARACDLGCGSGDLLTRLSQFGCEVVGVEPDPAAREVVRGKGHRVLPGTAEELPDEIRGERYDLVVLSHVLEHCLDPSRAVANAAGLLADRGVLVIETPNSDARGLGRAGVLWPWLDVPRHLNFFTSRSLAAICEGAGLAVRGVEYCGYTRQFLPGWIRAERRIRDAFSAAGGDATGLPGPHRGSSSWWLLLSTAWAPDRLKCDSVRVIVGHPSPHTKEEHA